jgi:hypothetical protein
MGLFTSVIAPCMRDKRYRLASGLSHLSLVRSSTQFQVTRNSRTRPESWEDFDTAILLTQSSPSSLSLPTIAPHVLAELLNAPTVGGESRISKDDNGFGAAVAY